MKLIFLLFSLAMAQAQFENKLIQAVNNESVADVKKLAQDKKLLQQKDSAGHDPLFHAVSLNNPKIVKVLLKAGASTDQTYNEKKESLLFEASRLGSVEVVESLLNAKPQLLKLKNTDNESVLFEAVRENQNELVMLYLKKGLSSSDKNKNGKIPADLVSPANPELIGLLKKSAK